ncbi:Nitrogen network kinase 1 [Spathaspora sp. JA1]|nr:Nitrogen network kinase 1 [Spathaspora sp. JA1]
MEIPLKSQPKVSTVNLLDDSKFRITTPVSPTDEDAHTQLPSNLPNKVGNSVNASNNLNNTVNAQTRMPSNYRFTRRFSESEQNNFDSETGRRIFDDGKIRPRVIKHDRLERQKTFTHLYGTKADPSAMTSNPSTTMSNATIPVNNNENAYPIESSPMRIYSRSHDSNIDVNESYRIGLEDEYIPGLNFSDMVYEWNKSTSDLDSKHQKSDTSINNTNNSNNSYTSIPNTPHSREESYLDLNKLHAQVSPQPIRAANQANKLSYSKLHEYMKTRLPGMDIPELVNDDNKSTDTLISTSSENKRVVAPCDEDGPVEIPIKAKKQKSISSTLLDPITGEINYEVILNSLPPNFNELPYSQRKKLVKSFSESIDYSQFSVYAKNSLGSSVGSDKRTPRSGGNSGNNSFIRRPRMGSLNTIAGRLLAHTSTNDLKKLHEQKYNIDEKGAVVMGHELGKIIGFGAWGTIRECSDDEGNIRAIKIVKCTRDFDTPHGSSRMGFTEAGCQRHNPKVLEVFKQEISIWKQLHHENILPLIDHLETENAIFCIMERIYGGTLFEVVTTMGQFDAGLHTTTGPLGFSIESQRSRLLQVIECTRQIVSALLYLHEQKGIVHGDLKLENVLVERNDSELFKVMLCDFGMSRIYSARVSRQSSTKHLAAPIAHAFSEDNPLTMRSRSSNTWERKPFTGGDTHHTKKLKLSIHDDSRVGLSNLLKGVGPSMQSIHLTPSEVYDLRQGKISPFKVKEVTPGVESGLPHSHIGSLPYAAPELLLPSPPPLGPSADVWALGVLMFAMCVGKLPFQHQYEPRLRAIISAGKFNKAELRKACLLEWVLEGDGIEEKESEEKEKDLFQSSSIVDLRRQAELEHLRCEWKEYQGKREFEWLYDIICGCLESNITKRWDTQKIDEHLNREMAEHSI